MYLSENDYIGKCSCIVCREIKSKKGIHTHYHISHTEFGKIQHKEKSRIAAQASGKATQKKFQELYSSNPQYCQQCNEIIPRTSYGKQFCSQSCSAKWSNTHRTRTKKPRPCCSHCNKPLDFVRKKFCNNICSSQARVKNTTDERKIKRKITQKRYYQRIKAQTPIDADRKAIREFYKNCLKDMK